MITIIDLPRQSGKTTKLVKLFEKNPGVMYVHRNVLARDLIKQHKSVKFDYYQFSINFSKYENYYFDEFFTNDFVSYHDIIRLDKSGKNVHIAGTKVTKFPDNFTKYLNINYPEYMI